MLVLPSVIVEPLGLGRGVCAAGGVLVKVAEGLAVGLSVGVDEGLVVGLSVGVAEGIVVGVAVGASMSPVFGVGFRKTDGNAPGIQGLVEDDAISAVV